MEVNLERIAVAIANEARTEGDCKPILTKTSGAEMQVPTSMVNQDTTSTTSSKALKRCLSVPIPRSQPTSREVSPAPVFNIFAPRGRRYSASYSPARGMGAAGGSSTSNAGNNGQSSRCVTPRISQLRQEECVDGLNSREVNHEREVHSAIQISQSWEDLSLVAENWSCKSTEELSNPLQVVVGGVLSGNGSGGCSSPSPTNNRANLRLPYGLSPSPTRRSTTFATRRSMSPIAIRPSQLGPVKRKFELDDTAPTTSSSTWNSIYSQPPSKKMFCESRGSSPICQSPSGSVCPSPDSGTGTYDGRLTPKLLISKLYTHNATSMNANNNTNSSACSSPMSASSYGGDVIETASTVSTHLCSSSSSSSSSSNSSSSIAISTASSNSEPMSLGSIDEGISLNDKILEEGSMSTTHTITPAIQDESTLMDIIKPAMDEECNNMIIENACVATVMDDKM
ncbi:P2R1A-PPP2R2A-interacting phosphatase regulator 1 [Stomoxys calcitrans]|uniref:P2R1A-PPP2R2A-interacting phosphatase regulator 1 n=1 Tax=Stomoxys calcitrans TaxID=35570 RepID=UPI0027E30F36|nr:P2R1A-PPP2R2A-interacting phosphatase regulator 1 [Stomoxys calcitrans]